MHDIITFSDATSYDKQIAWGAVVSYCGLQFWQKWKLCELTPHNGNGLYFFMYVEVEELKTENIFSCQRKLNLGKLLFQLFKEILVRCMFSPASFKTVLIKCQIPNLFSIAQVIHYIIPTRAATWDDLSRLMTKPTKWHVRPAKTRISLDIRTVWSVFAVRMKKSWVLSYPLSAQRRLIRLGGCQGWSESSLGAHAILLVLSWDGSFKEHQRSKKRRHSRDTMLM